MPSFEKIDLTDATLSKEFAIGCLSVKAAHLWPLSHYVWEASTKFVGVTFFTDAEEPWDEVGLMRIEVFKLPRAKSEFSERTEWYLEGRKSRRIKIRDGELFDESMLHVKGLKKSVWEQDSFAPHKGSVIRFYQQKKFAVIFRFLARSGNMLDHPVFKRAVKNIKFDEGLWERDPPEIIDTRSKSQKERETEATEDQLEEMWGCIGPAMKRLNIKGGAKRNISVISKEIDAARKNEDLDDDNTNELAYELGYLIGQMLCWELDWEWCNVDFPTEGEVFCVCSPDRGLVIDTVYWVYQMLTEIKRKNNCILTYNMLCAGKLPPSRPYSYSPIG